MHVRILLSSFLGEDFWKLALNLLFSNGIGYYLANNEGDAAPWTNLIFTCTVSILFCSCSQKQFIAYIVIYKVPPNCFNYATNYDGLESGNILI